MRLSEVIGYIFCTHCWAYCALTRSFDVISKGYLVLTRSICAYIDETFAIFGETLFEQKYKNAESIYAILSPYGLNKGFITARF